MNDITPVVKQLLIVNIVLFVAAIFLPNLNDLFALSYFESSEFKIWQPLTHMFMHAAFPSLSHILFNMFALFSFGSTLEHFWGPKRFLIFYFACGFGAAFIHTAVNYYQFHHALDFLVQNNYNPKEIISILNSGNVDTNWEKIMSPVDYNNMIEAFIGRAVGASGAIYGLIVAFAFMFPDAKLSMIFVPVPIPAKYFVPMLITFDLISGFNGAGIFGYGNIAHFAHIGGAVTGAILMMLWRNKKFKHNRWN